MLSASEMSFEEMPQDSSLTGRGMELNITRNCSFDWSGWWAYWRTLWSLLSRMTGRLLAPQGSLLLDLLGLVMFPAPGSNVLPSSNETGLTNSPWYIRWSTVNPLWARNVPQTPSDQRPILSPLPLLSPICPLSHNTHSPFICDKHLM